MSSITRTVSNAVYQTIQNEEILTGLRWQVYDYVFKNGPVTISQALRDLPHKRDSSINARFSELRARGAIREVGTVEDPLGRHIVTLWDVTDRVPLKEVDRITDKERLNWLDNGGRVARFSDGWNAWVAGGAGPFVEQTAREAIDACIAWQKTKPKVS